MPKLTYTNAKGLIQETGTGEVNLSGQGALFGQLCKISAITADTTLTAADSGKIFMVDPAATTKVTLPTIATSLAGWYCRIVLTENETGNAQAMDNKVNIDLGSGVNLANVGMLFESDGGPGDYAVANDDFVTFSANSSAGDKLDIFTDGTRWYIYGVVKEIAESTFATAAG
jgi:hypothetical protein